MPFIPHSQDEVKSMLATVGVKEVAQLFDEIPTDVRCQPLHDIPDAINEMSLGRIMAERAEKDMVKLNFIGAGCYQHHIPAAVWDIVSRGEFMTAYTPYQAEASQGGLQLLYEYQTMMASLMAMDVANASLYDGASALAEAVLMAVRANKKNKSSRVLVLGPIAPNYLKAVRAVTGQQGIDIATAAVDSLPKQADAVAVIIPQPNFLGEVQQVDQLTDWAQQQGALVIALVNPLAMALLTPPGQWGENGADIACGEGQPLGVPMSNGGPFFGFMACKQAIMRQLPGRIVGKTTDVDGKPAYCLTLQAREQHIRRGKATSNICTNQGLLVTAATIYMALMGPEGLRRTALASHHNAMALQAKLTKIPGVKLVSTGTVFHEFVIRIPQAKKVQQALAKQGIQLGYALEDEFPDYQDCLLLCSTEIHNAADHDCLIEALRAVMNSKAKEKVSC